jgi:hypothetical protein
MSLDSALLWKLDGRLASRHPEDGVAEGLEDFTVDLGEVCLVPDLGDAAKCLF